MSSQTDSEPYGDFIPFDPECARVKELLHDLGAKALTDEQAAVHRSICERCMMLAVLSSEIVVRG